VGPRTRARPSRRPVALRAALRDRPRGRGGTPPLRLAGGGDEHPAGPLPRAAGDHDPPSRAAAVRRSRARAAL